jgi:large subunit ribosomal protein L9
LYGSINTQMIAEAVSDEIGVTVEAKQIESQPLRMLGSHRVAVRLTVDLIPEIEIIVHREGETPESALEEEEQEALRAEQALEEIIEEETAELEADTDADSDESEQTEETDLPNEIDEEPEENEEA